MNCVNCGKPPVPGCSLVADTTTRRMLIDLCSDCYDTCVENWQITFPIYQYVCKREFDGAVEDKRNKKRS